MLIVGITEFTAPELREFKDHDEKADIWSLGVLLLSLLFEHDQRIELQAESEDEDEHRTVIHCPERTPAWLLNILNQLLAYHPKDRYKIQDALMTIDKAIACSDTIAKIMDQL